MDICKTFPTLVCYKMIVINADPKIRCLSLSIESNSLPQELRMLYIVIVIIIRILNNIRIAKNYFPSLLNHCVYYKE
jgi:hypothetical protein